MLRLLPMGLFGAFLGALRRTLRPAPDARRHGGPAGPTSALLAIIAGAGHARGLASRRASFVNGFGWAPTIRVRRMMIGEAVGRERMGTAMSLDVGANNASRMVGPTFGGLLLAGIGIEGVFMLSVVLYAIAVWRALAVRTDTVPASRRRARARAHRRRPSRWSWQRPAAGRHPAGHRHLQRFRLAVHQHDPGDRPRPAALGPEGSAS